jgi:chemotaxis signal transduction protein
MIVVLPGGRDEAVGLIVDSVGEILTPVETEPSGGASIPWVAEGLLTGALEVEGRQVLLPDLAKLAGLS